MDKGFIKVYRNILTCKWYVDSAVKSVFLHLLLTANISDNTWRGTEIKRGQVLTSYSKLAADLGLSVKQVRRALDILKDSHVITHSKANRNANHCSLITLCNYDSTQGGQTKGHDLGQTKGQTERANLENSLTTSNRESYKGATNSAGQTKRANQRAQLRANQRATLKEEEIQKNKKEERKKTKESPFSSLSDDDFFSFANAALRPLLQQWSDVLVSIGANTNIMLEYDKLMGFADNDISKAKSILEQAIKGKWYHVHEPSKTRRSDIGRVINTEDMNYNKFHDLIKNGK